MAARLLTPSRLLSLFGGHAWAYRPKSDQSPSKSSTKACNAKPNRRTKPMPIDALLGEKSFRMVMLTTGHFECPASTRRFLPLLGFTG